MTSTYRIILCATFALFFGLGILSSCEEPAPVTPVPSDTTDRRDSTDITDSVDHKDSTSAIDSASNLMAPPHGFRAMLITKAGDSLALNTYSATANHYQYWDGSQKLTIVTYGDSTQNGVWFDIPGVTGQGKYIIEDLPNNTTLVRHKGIDGRMRSGWIDITQLDPDKHELTATFEIEFSNDKSKKVLHNLTGEFNRIDLTTESHKTKTVITMDDTSNKPWKYSLGSSSESVAEKRLTLNGSVWEVFSCPPYSGQRQFTIELSIVDPQEGLFTPGGNVTWSFTENVSAYRLCSSYTKVVVPLPTDSLVIESYDPLNRSISGWFTLEGKRGAFTFTCWSRIHPPQ